MPTLTNARSNVITSNTLVHTGKGRVNGYIASATAATTITLYDNTAASGTKVHEITVTTTPLYVRLTYQGDSSFTIPFSTGLYAVVPAGASLNIWFDTFTT